MERFFYMLVLLVLCYFAGYPGDRPVFAIGVLIFVLYRTFTGRWK